MERLIADRPGELSKKLTASEVDAWARWRIAQSPITLLQAAGIEPDPWQLQVLTSDAPRICLLCSRQSGKSTLVAAKALWHALKYPQSLTLIGSPSQRQSAELLAKAMAIYAAARPMTQTVSEAVLRVKLENSSRLLCVPGRDGTVRSYSAVSLLIVDECAWVSSQFLSSVLPMLAVSRGQLILLSTPHAKQGEFYEIWEHAPEYRPDVPVELQPDSWLKIKIPWWECPRITQAYIDEYRALEGDLNYTKEFLVEFVDSESAVFTRSETDRMQVSSTETWELF